MPLHPSPATNAKSQDNLIWLKIVRDQVTSLNHGTIDILVHEGKVMELRKSERVRLQSVSNPRGAGIPPEPGQ